MCACNFLFPSGPLYSVLRPDTVQKMQFLKDKSDGSNNNTKIVLLVGVLHVIVSVNERRTRLQQTFRANLLLAALCQVHTTVVELLTKKK